jgi:D-alanyl-D-alanine carboxypeptidase
MRPPSHRPLARLLVPALAAVLALATAAGVRAAAGYPQAAGSPATGSPAQLERQVDRWRERAGVPAITVALQGPGGRRFLDASGVAERGGGSAARVDSQFRVASITKTFVATVVLQLVEEGRLGLDDPVTRHLPGVPHTDGVTIRQLLNHTSGIPDYGRAEGFKKRVLSDRERRWTSDDVLALVAGARRDFAPGTDYSYSNTGYVLLGRVIEQVTGSTWAAQVRRRILDPLRLRHTYVSGIEPVPGGVLPGYFDAGRPWPALETLEDAAGAVVSTAPDLAMFGEALFGGRLLRPGTLHQMVTEGPHRVRTAGYGLGVEVLRPDYRLTLWGHGGSTLGFRSVLLFVPGRDLVVVVLANDFQANPVDLAELLIRAELAFEE